MFANPANINAYLITIAWSDAQKCLVFEEKSRFDGKYRQVGTVYIPFGTAFMNLVSSSAGNVRTVLLSLPDTEDMMRGIISTLSNPKGSIYIPVAAPIVLRKLRAGEEPELGVITRDQSPLRRISVLAGDGADRGIRDLCGSAAAGATQAGRAAKR